MRLFIGLTRKSIAMPKKSADTTSPLVQQSYLVDHPARQPLQPDGEKESKTSAGSGAKPSASSAKSSPKSVSSRMWPVFGRSMAGVPLSKSSGNLPKAGLMLRGDIYELPTLERPIDESELLLWPTPNLPNGGRSIPDSATWSGMAAYLPSGKKVQVGLESAVRREWPTPMAQDGDKNSPATKMGLPHALKEWRTPTSRDHHPAGRWGRPGRQVQVQLAHQVEDAEKTEWATPQSRDYRSPDNPSSPRWKRKVDQGWSFNLNDQVANWPTPKANSNRNSRQSLTAQHWSAPALEQAVELSSGILPREYQSLDELPPVAQAMWSTPVAHNQHERMTKYAQGGTPLTKQVQDWATPTAHLKDMDTMERNKFSRTALRQMKESGQPYQTVSAGPLNPCWVESLLNLPPNWTKLED